MKKTNYNIYFGTIGNQFGYRYTRGFKSDKEAKEYARKEAESFYYKNEGKYGLPTFSDISKEAKITGLSLETLYQDHINDMCRWYAIPTSLDTISIKKLKY